MAICSNCNSESARVRSRWNGSVQLPDECPACAPQSFEKLSDPSTRKIWIGPEFAPNDYEVHGDALVMKPEAIAELEERACGLKSVAAQQEMEAIAKAEAEKRATRRTKPMTQAEIEQALAFANRVIRPMVEDTDIVYEV